MSNILEYEQLAIGILINNSDLKDDMELMESDFSSSSNQLVFRCLTEMIDSGIAVDAMLLAHNLENQGLLSKIGGLSYISSLSNSAPARENFRSYAEIVKKQSSDRRFLQGGTLINTLLSAPGLAEDKISEAESILDSLMGVVADKSNQIHIEVALQQSLDYITDKVEKEGRVDYPFGFSDLDEMTCGASPGDVIVIAARPSMGKTAFAMNIAEHLCTKSKVGLVVSIEMGAAQLGLRLFSSIGQIDAQKLRKATLDEEDWERLSYALGKASKMNLFIDESSSVTPAKIRRAAKQVQRKAGAIDFIVIDYLQLMGGDKQKYDNRGAEIGDISRRLKLLAKELGVPVFLLSQLNRSLEQRPNKRPIMSDLRESGAIEQDADLILFIYRDEVYNSDSSDKGMAEIIIAKQRNGPTGSVQLAFRGVYSKFEDVRRVV